jgi:small conductance mechanosensitive channel
MKSFLLLFWILCLPLGCAAAQVDSSVKTEEKAPAPIKVSEINANLCTAISDFFKGTKKSFFQGVVSVKDFEATGKWVVKEIKNAEMQKLMRSFGVQLAVSFAIAFGIAQLISFWIRPKINRLLLKTSPLSLRKYQRNGLAILLSMAAPLVFGFLLYAVFHALNFGNEIYLETVQILSSGFVTVWILLNIARLFLKPLTPDHQQIPLPQEAMTSLYIWIRRIAFVALFGFFILEMGRLLHLPYAGEKVLLQLSSFAIALLAILMLVSFHDALKIWIQGQRASIQRSRLKRSLLPYLEYSYLPLLILIVISYISWVTLETDHFQVIVWKVLLTLSLLPLLKYASYCLKKMRLLYIHRNLKRLSPAFSQRAIFYGQQIDSILKALLYIMAVLMVLDLWGFDFSAFMASKRGKFIFEKAFSIFTIVAVTLFINRAGLGLLNKYLSVAQEAQSEAYKQKMARFKTIHTVSRNMLRIVIWVPALLLIMVEMDIPIIPILAPLTIIGGGLALGVQSIVKDFVTGFSMLMEDAFAVGDLVVINGQMGRIESLGVRVVRLRATDGALYVFPYGNISTFCNQNRDYSAVVILFQVGINTDVSQLYEMLDQISKDLRKDPKVRPLLAGSIEIDGVNEISDYALQVRAVLKTKPGKHFKVKWAFNFLLKQYLESYQIPSAHPRQVAYNYALEK